MVSLTITPTQAPTADILRPEENGVFYSDYLINFEGVIGYSKDSVDELTYVWSSSVNRFTQF